jgi:antitoxin MazE
MWNPCSFRGDAYKGMRMETLSRVKDIKLISIGNSKGVRIPKAILQKYGFSDTLLLEETEKGILLRKKDEQKLSWEDTFKAMAAEQEDWEDFDTTLLDGLDDEFDSETI